MSVAILEKPQETENRFRRPMLVTHIRKYRSTAYYICPRCGITIEREFMAYCDRCGQCLSWKHYKRAEVITK